MEVPPKVASAPKGPAAPSQALPQPVHSGLAGTGRTAPVLAKVSGVSSPACIHKVGVHAGERSQKPADRDQRKQHEVEE